MIKKIFELDIKYRIPLSFLLALLTLVLQTSGVSFVIWVPVLLFSAALMWVKSVKIEEDFSPQRREWKEVTIKEFLKAFEKARRARKLSTMNLFSRVMTVFIVGIFAFAFLPVFSRSFFGKDGFYLFIDATVIFLAVYLSGSRRIWAPSDLYIKLDSLMTAYYALKNEPALIISPQFFLKKDKKGRMVPVDSKLFVRGQDLPDWIIGLQFQVSINSVQNKRYPYLYSVIILKSGKLSEVLEKEKGRGKISASVMKRLKELCKTDEKKIIIEAEENPDVDVVIIRQRTSKRGGYYTNKRAIERIVRTSLAIFRCLVKKNEG